VKQQPAELFQTTPNSGLERIPDELWHISLFLFLSLIAFISCNNFGRLRHFFSNGASFDMTFVFLLADCQNKGQTFLWKTLHSLWDFLENQKRLNALNANWLSLGK
jgi:hypothetical protein